MAQFTKKAIIDSFVKLLFVKPFDKITVKDIVEDCGVNRNTFYYYYRDTFDMLNDVVITYSDAMISNCETFTSLEQGLVQLVRLAANNKKAFYNVYHYLDRKQIEKHLSDVIVHLVQGFVRVKSEGLDVPERDRKLTTDFFRHAILGFVIEWIDGGMKPQNHGKPGDLVRELIILLDNTMGRILLASSKRHKGKDNKKPRA